jgi:hypothetical protein
MLVWRAFVVPSAREFSLIITGFAGFVGINRDQGFGRAPLRQGPV